MKKILSILALLALCCTARAQFITATLTVTNTPGNTDTLTVGSYTFNWTNNTPIGNFAVLYTNNVNTNATNLFTVTGAVLPPVGIFTTQTGTNVLTFQGIGLTASRTAGWASLVLTTNGSATPPAVVSTPIAGTSATAAAQTNVMSSLVADLNALSTNSFSTNAILLIAYVSTNGTFYGIHYGGIVSNATAISGNVAFLTNGVYMNPVFSNAQNFGDPFRSPGGGTGSEQFGLGASAGAGQSIAFGDNAFVNSVGTAACALGYSATAVNPYDVAFGAATEASGGNSTAIGTQATAQGTNAVAIGGGPSGQGAIASGSNSVAIGHAATAANNNSMAIGTGATTTADNQIMLGTSSTTTVTAGTLQVINGLSNFTTFPSGTYVFNGTLITPSAPNVSLANSNNAGVVVGTNSFVRLSGPTGTFYIAGIAGGTDGRRVTLENDSGQIMVIGNESGGDSTSANRIETGYGAANVGPQYDRAFTNNPGIVHLYYNGAKSRWIVEDP